MQSIQNQKGFFTAIQSGADRLAKMEGGFSPAALACQKGHVEVVLLLEESGPN
jgi:hypothetical protein